MLQNSSKCLAATLMYISAVLPTNAIVHGDQEIPELLRKPGVSINLTDHDGHYPVPFESIQLPYTQFLQDLF